MDAPNTITAEPPIRGSRAIVVRVVIKPDVIAVFVRGL
jgi:hypothetical protein